MGSKVYIMFQAKDLNVIKTIHEINRGMSSTGQSAQQASRQVDAFFGLFKAAVIVDFFRQAGAAAYQFGVDAVAAYTKAKVAKTALESVSTKQAGLGSGEAANAIANLPIVQKGVIPEDIAQGAIRNLLSMNFTLEQSITLLNGMTDVASVARQSHLNLAEAVSYGAEGLKNANSVQYDGIGISENLAAQYKRLGFETETISRATEEGAKARNAFVNDFLKQIAPFAGQSLNALQGLQGATTELDTAYRNLLITVGEQISKNPALVEGVGDIAKAVIHLRKELEDPKSGASQFLKQITDLFGQAARSAAFLLETVRALSGALKSLAETSGISLLIRATGGNDKGAQLIREAQVMQNNFDLAVFQARNQPARYAQFDREAREKALRFTAGQDASATAFKESRQKSIDEDRKKEAADAQKLAKLQQDAVEAVAGLRSQFNTINPFAVIYERAEKRQSDFLQRFKGVTAEVTAEFQKQNQLAVQNESFQAEIAHRQRVNDLLREQASLIGAAAENMRAESERQFSFFQGQSGFQRQIDQLRFGEEDPVTIAQRTIREAAGSLSGLALSKAIAEATSGLNLDQLRGSGLDFTRRNALLDLQGDQQKQFQEQQSRDAALREATARQLAAAQSFLTKAANDVQKQAALDAIIASTSDTSKLSADQIGSRNDALVQNIELQARIAEQQAQRMQLQIEAMKANTEVVKELKEEIKSLIQVEREHTMTLKENIIIDVRGVGISSVENKL